MEKGVVSEKPGEGLINLDCLPLFIRHAWRGSVPFGPEGLIHWFKCDIPYQAARLPLRSLRLGNTHSHQMERPVPNLYLFKCFYRSLRRNRLCYRCCFYLVDWESSGEPGNWIPCVPATRFNVKAGNWKQFYLDILFFEAAHLVAVVMTANITFKMTNNYSWHLFTSKRDSCLWSFCASR